MANTDPEALKAAQAAYAASNASLKDYDPETQAAKDLQFLSTQGGPNTHPEEPVLTRAEDTTVDIAPPVDKSSK